MLKRIRIRFDHIFIINSVFCYLGGGLSQNVKILPFLNSVTQKHGYILGPIFSVLSGHAWHFGLIYSIKSSYYVVKRMQISISDTTNALKKLYLVMTSAILWRHAIWKRPWRCDPWLAKEEEESVTSFSNVPKSRYDLVFRQFYTKYSNIY